MNPENKNNTKKLFPVSQSTLKTSLHLKIVIFNDYKMASTMGELYSGKRWFCF